MRKRTYLKLAEHQEKQACAQHTQRDARLDFYHRLQPLKGQMEAGETERALAYIRQLDQTL